MRFGRDRELLTVVESSSEAAGQVDNRQMGDLCRDRGVWVDAAKYYRIHLEAHPEDVEIWVQLGHCLKENGLLDKSEQAYDRALAITDDNYDVYLHKGHLAKLKGSSGDAIFYYKKSLSLRQDGNDALRELIALRAFDAINEVMPRLLPPVESSHVIYLDITDLVEYVKKNLSLSGIQRVVSNLANFSFDSSTGEAISTIQLVIPEYDRSRIYVVNRALVQSMIEIIEHSGADRQLLDNAVQAVYDSRVSVEPQSGDIFAIAGAFWIYDNYDMIAELRNRGVYFAIFIHDLIQIKNPEYVHKEATLVFCKSLVDVLMLADIVLTNSEYVAGEVRQFAETRLGVALPIRAIPLATELRALRKSTGRIARDIVEVCCDEFVLCVCTIEVRKNHMYLVRIWEKLIQEAKDNIPNLVFVGKWGWDVEPLRNYLDSKGMVGNWLHIFNGVSDDELDYLYKHCLFTVFPSFAEGWGLPVGESLAYGKPCVASEATSIPEVGGTLARYIDPTDWRSGYNAIRHLLTDRDDLSRWAEQVRSEFRSKTWSAFCAEVFSTIGQIREVEASVRFPNNCILPSREILYVGDDDLRRLDEGGDTLITFRMARVGGWHSVEPWGVWASQRRARLQFRTNLAENDEVKLYLRLQVPPDSESPRCVVRVGGRETTLVGLTTHPIFYQVNGRISRGGAVQVDLTFGGIFGKPDNRFLYGGLSALGLSKTDDAMARIELLEKLTLSHFSHLVSHG